MALFGQLSKPSKELPLIDVSNPDYKEQRDDVLNVLHELGLTKIEFEGRYVEVFNKIDLLSESEKKHLQSKIGTKTAAVSALSGEGINDFLQLLKTKFSPKAEIKTVSLPIDDGKKLAEIYRSAQVLDRRDDGERIFLRIKLPS